MMSSAADRNARSILLAELMKYLGQGIAKRPDVRRIVAGHADMAMLNSPVAAAGEGPERTKGGRQRARQITDCPIAAAFDGGRLRQCDRVGHAQATGFDIVVRF